MQSGGREYNGRNQYWTPSNIGLTQSMIDTSINRIELKDNSGESNLFTVVDNKIKPTVPMVCDTPTANEEVSNKKYTDDNISTVNTNLSNNYYNKSTIDTKISDLNTKITALDSGYANVDSSYTQPLKAETYTISNIKSLSFTNWSLRMSNIPTIILPCGATKSNTVSLVLVNFMIYTTKSENIDAMRDLVCTIDYNNNSLLNRTYNKPIIIGSIKNGTDDSKIYAAYYISEIIYNINNRRNLYLHFFYESDKTYSNVSFTLENRADCRLQLGIHELQIWDK